MARSASKPVNLCIYCGSKSAELTDEHVVPYALGGTLVIPQASCKICQTQINIFETSVATETYISFRSAPRFPSRTNSLLTNIPVIFQSGGTETACAIPIDDAPLYSVIPHFGLPPYLNNSEMAPASLNVSAPQPQVWHHLFQKYFPTAENARVETYGIRIEHFVRLVFKIAYGFGWLVDPACAFRWQGREKILHGNFPNFPYFEDIFSVHSGPLEDGAFRVTVFTECSSGKCELYCQVEILPGEQVPAYICRLGPTNTHHPFGIEFTESTDWSERSGMHMRLVDCSPLK